MSNGKAKTGRSIADDIVKLKRDRAKGFGLERRNASGIASVTATGGANRGASVNSNSLNTLKTAGDTMIGPIAFYPKVQQISAGVLDIAEGTDTGYSSRVIVLGQASAADDLDTISGAAFSGQLLFLQAVNTTPITLKHLAPTTGNIFIPTLADYTVTDKEIVILQWDNINEAYAGSGGQWSAVGNFTAAGGGGGGTSFSGFVADADLDMGAFDIDLNGNTLFLDADNDTLIESSSDDQLKLSSGGTNVINIKPTEVLVTQPLDLIFTNIKFTETYGAVFDSDEDTTITGGTNIINIATNGSIRFTIGTSSISAQLNLDMNGNDIQDVDKITFNNNTTNDFIESTLSGVEYNVNSTDEHIFRVGGNEVMRVDSTQLELNDNLDMQDNDIKQVDRLEMSTTGQVLSTNASEILYQVGSGDAHGFYVAAAKTLEINQTHLVMQTGKEIDFGANVAVSANSGGLTLPSNPQGFLKCRVNGGDVRIPYYQV